MAGVSGSREAPKQLCARSTLQPRPNLKEDVLMENIEVFDRYFGLAMQGLIAGKIQIIKGRITEEDADYLAENAYVITQSMIKIRLKIQESPVTPGDAFVSI